MDTPENLIGADPEGEVDRRLKLMNAATQLEILTAKLKGTTAEAKMKEDLAQSPLDPQSTKVDNIPTTAQTEPGDTV